MNEKIDQNKVEKHQITEENGSYKSYRIIDGKAKWILVDKNGKITDKTPNRVQIKQAKRTTGRVYDPINGFWNYKWEREHKKDFNNIIVYCADKNGKTIERIYIFPKEEVIRSKTVSIVKNHIE